MTEDQAKTKWCPFTRVGSTFNRHRGGLGLDHNTLTSSGENDLTELKCIASACMAWRQRHQWFDNAQQEPDWVSYAPYAFEPGQGQEREDGFCGLAGAPQ